MDIRQTVADSLAATTRSKQEEQVARQLARQARHAISDRALMLADGVREAVGIKTGDAIVAEWNDIRGRLRRIVVTPSGNVLSVTYTNGRPSGRHHTTHRLTSVPLAHLEEHFGPLMKADFTVAAQS